MCFKDGRGTREDLARAREWLQKAADAGLAIAQARLATMVAVGTPGFGPDPKGAVELLDKASASQDSVARLQVAICYLQGNGIPQDREKARKILEAASLEGDAAAAEIYKIYFGKEF